MNNSQVKGHADEAKEKAGKDSDESETVLREVNDDTEKHSGKARGESGDTDDASKSDGKDHTVLGELNDDPEKGKK